MITKMATLQMALIYSGKKVKFVKFKCMVTGTCIIGILFYRNPTLINAVTLDELDDPMEEAKHFLGDNLQDGNPPEDAPPAGDHQDGNAPEDAPPAGDHQDGNAPEDAPPAGDHQDGNAPEDAPPAGDHQDGNPPEDAPPAGDHQDGNPPEDDPPAGDHQDSNPSQTQSLPQLLLPLKDFQAPSSSFHLLPPSNLPRKEDKSRKRKNDQAMDMMFKRRQRRKMVHINYNSPINVEEYQPKTSQATKQWLPELNLSQFDHEVLLSPTSWLTDSIIDASQKLLQRMFPAISGFQSVCLGLTSFQVQPGEFIQIINSRGHWVTVSTIGTIHPNIHVYDSLYSCANTYLKTQIACLLASEEPELQLSCMNMMMQSGPSECGVFAIAFATALAYGENPTQYLFDQSKMRLHLTMCLEQGQMTMFPFKKLRRVKKAVKTMEKVRIYCSCCMPDLPDTKWIECTKCKEWYHAISCVVVPRTAFKSKVPWFCLKCK